MVEWRSRPGYRVDSCRTDCKIKYSCFNDALCILEWKPTREQEIIALPEVETSPCFKGSAAHHRGPTSSSPWARNHPAR